MNIPLLFLIIFALIGAIAYGKKKHDVHRILLFYPKRLDRLFFYDSDDIQ